jgi:hypothetical protein
MRIDTRADSRPGGLPEEISRSPDGAPKSPKKVPGAWMEPEDIFLCMCGPETPGCPDGSHRYLLCTGGVPRGGPGLGAPYVSPVFARCASRSRCVCVGPTSVSKFAVGGCTPARTQTVPTKTKMQKSRRTSVLSRRPHRANNCMIVNIFLFFG